MQDDGAADGPVRSAPGVAHLQAQEEHVNVDVQASGVQTSSQLDTIAFEEQRQSAHLDGHFPLPRRTLAEGERRR
jgi:hypothetical protein